MQERMEPAWISVRYRTVLYIHVLAFLIQYGISDIVIEPEGSVEVLEFTKVSFTCNFTDNTVTTCTWFINREEVVNMTYSNNHCTATSSMKNTFFNVNCTGKGVFTLTFLNVTRLLSGKKIGCGLDWDIKETNIYIQVPVSYVHIEVSSSDRNLTVRENDTITIKCQSSYSRPKVNTSLLFSDGSTVYTEKRSDYTHENDTLWLTETDFDLSANRASNGKKIFCKATNYLGEPVSSETVFLNIQYPPSLPPKIGNLSNNTVYKIKENTTGQLWCNIEDSNPPSLLNWTCLNIQSIKLSGNKTHRNILFMALRNTSAECSCISVYNKTERSSLRVEFNVLYAPDTITTTLGSYESIRSEINVTENQTLTFNCSANGNPPPNNYSWSGVLSSNTRVLTFYATKRDTGTIICSASNKMEETEANDVTIGTKSKAYLLTVLYPPEIDVKDNYSVIETESFTTPCTAVDGLTTDQSVNWNTSNSVEGRNASILSILDVTRNMSGTYICLLNYTLAPTYGEKKTYSKSKQLLLNVLYPPEQFLSSMTLNGKKYNDISSRFSVVENASLLLVCSARGNPVPTKYTWTGSLHNDSEILQFLAKSNMNGNITCNAVNTLTPADEKSRQGLGNKTYQIEVLYRPSILQLRNYSVLEGKEFNTTCKLEPGRTTSQSITWLKDSQNVLESSDLHFQNTTRKMSGTYICQLNLTMNPTYGLDVTEVHTQSFFLDVLFPPENMDIRLSLGQVKFENISNNFSVVENKTSDMILNCSAFSNPLPTNFLWKGSTSNDSSILHLIPMRNITGKYTCSVNNTMVVTYAVNESKLGTASKVYDVSVLFPPSIQQLENLTILEGNDFKTTCVTDEGRTTTQSLKWLSEFTTDDNFSVLSIPSIQRNNTGIFICQQNFTLQPTYGDTVADIHRMIFFLDVLYPPDVVTVNISIGPELHEDIQRSIILIENEIVVLDCSATGNPKPKAFWFGTQRGSDTETLELRVYRNVTGSYRCVAKNTMNLTYEKETIAGEKGKNYSISVLYPPVFEDHDQYDVIECQDISINCSKPGMTSSQDITWSEGKTNSDLGRKNTLSLDNVTRSTSKSVTCTLNYTMKPTYGEGKQEVHSKTFKLNVLYPPENISADVRGIQSQEVTITNVLNVIENDIRELDINCTASANPVLNNVSWTGPQGSQSSHLRLKAHRQFNGTYTCHAKNEMIPTKGYPQTGYRNRSYSIDFLYQPKLRGYEEKNVTIGTNVVEDCIEVPGNTNSVTVCWTGGNKESRKCNQTLTILNATADDSGLYNCTVHFIMVPTFGDEISLSISTSLYINVFDNSNVEKVIGDGPGSSVVGAAIGGALAGFAVVIATICTLFVVKKRRLLSSKDKGAESHAYENIGFAHDPKQDKRLPAPPPSDESEVKEDDVTNYIAETEISNPEENTYMNTAEVTEVLRIGVSELFMYVSNKSKGSFFEEFEKLPKGTVSTIPCTVARKPENVALNRYQGIYPYDHSRVHILEQPAFFINANYIDGYARPRQYIASLGPTERHTLGFTTFWNMVWYEKADVIVMLTNLSEPSGMKCEQYWPDYSKRMEVDNFLIQSETEEEAAEYTVRTFTILKEEESRIVTQLHYTAWPDKTVPESVTSLIEFRQRVKTAPTRSLGPLVVHCSAGVGRTGTYIALDRLIEEGKSTDYVKVFDCVNNMRKQRVNMVQTLEQYVYLHQALVYCLAFDIEPVTAETIGEYIQTTSNNVFSQLYQQLKQTVEKESDEYTEAQNKHASFIEWNRRRADIPGDRHRVLLSLDKEFGQSNYINAMYLASFIWLDHFIVAQSPLPKTVEDFVGMLYQEKSACIVALDDYRQKGTNNAVYLPAENDQFTYGFFSISCLSVEAKPAYVVRKLRLKHEGKHEQGEKVAYHFEFTAWKHDEKLPKDPKMFVEFVREIEDYAKESTEENPHVVVHCMSGSERSGLFCAVSNLIQKMELEQQVSVVNMLRRVRERRRTAISSMEQLKFCYHAVNAFVKKTQHLSTRKKSFLVHYENNA